MSKSMSIACLALLAAGQLCTAAAQQPLSAAKCFAEAPEAIIPSLDRSTRLDMLDYFHAGLTKASPTVYDGSALIVAEDSTSLGFVIGDRVVADMFVLNPDSPDPIIGYITTLPTPIPDSSLQFFNSRWQPISPSPLPAPTLSAWLTPEGKKHRAEVEEQIPFILASISFNPETLTITYANNTQQYFSAFDTPEALQYLRPKLKFRWNGSQFKPISDK